MFSAEDLMVPLASMFDYGGNTSSDQRSSSTRRSTSAPQKDYKWIQVEDTAVSDFTVQFDKGLGKKQKDFYRSKYPKVDKVIDDRIHCTSCDTHLGSAPIDEVTIREHPVLKVTQCSKCYAFYTSGEFDKGEDGSELYCRWCGQGGEVYCCAKCPYVFCKKCIVRNLSKDTIKAIIKDENWVCFSCEPEVTWPLRAKHWALMNFIEKQRKVILSQYVSDSDVNTLLSRDLTTCCQKAIPPAMTSKKSITPGKAAPTSKAPPSKPMVQAPVQKSATRTRKRTNNDRDYTPGPPSKRPMTEIPQSAMPIERSQDEVVCTPDILSMFESNNTDQTPPPLTQIPRQYGTSANGTTASTSKAAGQKKTQTITIANQSPATPIYHTINGYRIDLNSAARQETIRLPNGKLIQVKKQSTPQQQQQLAQPPLRGMRPQAPTRAQQLPVPRGINQMQSRRQTPVRQQIRPQMPQVAQQQRPLILNGMMQPQFNVPPLIISQQAANTPYGKAKTELDSRIRNGQEICMHIIGKMNTLVASNAYKSMKSQKDVKEIHIHLSYLLTYAINRFKTLQEKSMENMKTLGFGGDVASIMSGKITTSTPEEGDGDDDDIEIVEPQTTLIDLASDEEDQVTNEVVTEETTKAKESQAFLDKLKLHPKIVLKKLPKERSKKTTAEKTNEKIVRGILNDILEKVFEVVAPDVNGKVATEEMEVDVNPDTISIDDDDSEDGVEVVEKVQKEDVGKETAHSSQTTESANTSKEIDADDAAPSDALEANDDVAKDTGEDAEMKDNEDNADKAKTSEKADDEDADMTEIDSGSNDVEKKIDDVSDKTHDDEAQKEEIQDDDVENKSEDQEKEDEDEENKGKDQEKVDEDEEKADEDEEKADEDVDMEGEDMKNVDEDQEKLDEDQEKDREDPKATDKDSNEKDVVSAEKSKDREENDAPSNNDDEDASHLSSSDLECIDKAVEDTEEPISKDVLESPASPDPADVTPAPVVPKGFEDIDSPDEFDDALDTPATEDDLLNDLVKPNDVPFSDDLDSLGKFLDN
uniref:Putative transcription initiation factor iif n=1 Tax=Nyssomyia neivai TaxID=330878 RepID=A0A1L8DFY4_9DIPT